MFGIGTVELIVFLLIGVVLFAVIGLLVAAAIKILFGNKRE
jgi:cytosine/uracil/thiamine/allantoin permease